MYIGIGIRLRTSHAFLDVALLLANVDHVLVVRDLCRYGQLLD